VNGKKIVVLIVGILLAVVGIIVVLQDVDAILYGKVAIETGKIVLYVGLGAFGLGAYLIDPAWVVGLVEKAWSFLPWGNKGTTT
jgi:divalent metal cation (Fe/Co/Zn/Cd) transporter